MKSMTDFIDASSMDIVPAIYNEEYTWAEEYADLYNEYSSEYLEPVFESSGYQFFGEAALSPRKSFMAAGILALVSGAFFMIMKLLNGGGSGGSGGSGSKDLMADFNKRNREREAELNEALEDARVKLNKAFGHGNNSNEDNKSSNSPTPVPPAPTTNTVSTSKNDTTPTTPSESKTTEKLPELEAEENIVFNVKTIIDALNDFKKKNGNAGTPYNRMILKFIYDGLKNVDSIVEDMVRITQEDLWYVVSSSDTRDRKVSKFIEDKVELDETISHLKRLSKEDLSKNDVVDAPVDQLIDRLNEIDETIKSIESNCKKGMKICREKRQLEKYKKDVPNIDKVYTLLNGVLKGLNVVCKNIQDEFKTIKKSISGAWHRTLAIYFPTSHSSFGPNITKTVNNNKDDVQVDTKQLAFELQNAKNSPRGWGAISFILSAAIIKDKIRMLYEPENRTDAEIKKFNDKTKKEFLDRLNNIRKKMTAAFKNLKKQNAAEETLCDDVLNLLYKQLDLVSDLVNTPPSSTFDKSIDEIPAAKKLKEFNENDFENEVKDIQVRYGNNKSKMDSLIPHTPVGEFYTDIAKTMKDLKGVIPDHAYSHFAKTFSNGSHELTRDPSDEEDGMHKVIGAIEKYVYGSDTSLSDPEWERVESWLESIGFKSLNINPGDKLDGKIRTYFARPIPAKTDDKSKDMTVKQIQQQPRKLDIVVDGSKTTFKLAGKCTYWKY